MARAGIEPATFHFSGGESGIVVGTAARITAGQGLRGMRYHRVAMAINGQTNGHPTRTGTIMDLQSPETRRRSRLSRERRMGEARALGTHTPEEWNAKIKALGGRCYYCKGLSKRMHQDHLTPVSRGGSDAIDNLTLACYRCDTVKGTMTEAEFYDYLAMTRTVLAPIGPRRRRVFAR